MTGQDLETGCLGGPDEYGPLDGKTQVGTAAERLWQDDLHLACGLGRAAG